MAMPPAVNDPVQSTPHRAVLLDAAVAALAIRPDGRYLDATYGRGGHAGAILARLGRDGHMLAVDRDPAAIRDGLARYGADPRFAIEHTAFSGLDRLVRERDWAGRVDGVLADLGVSSPQLDESARGFSFLRDGPLDMRMDPSRGPSAAEWLARASAQQIAGCLREYGEERDAARIARAIVAERTERPIETTGQLAGLIERVVRRREPGRHPATRAFQAIRIQVNGELDELRTLLDFVLGWLAPGGRLAVISFHSLEDRMVKRWMRDHARPPQMPRGLPAPEVTPPMRLVGQAVFADEDEIAANPRARSAVLRVAERVQ